jgi:nucleoside-diphosphate-sugar epimerase
MSSPSVAASPRVLVTGASGFIGRCLLPALSERGYDCRGTVRTQSVTRAAASLHAVGDIGPTTDWTRALEGVSVVVHLAGRAHVLHETASDPAAEFMRVNAQGTAALAAAARAAGVRRFIYISSIGVLGLESGDRPFSAASTPHPHSPYTRSKLEGEIAARSFANASFDVIVLRPPLVYGAGARANVLRLLRWVDRAWPLPLGAVRNRRSLVSVWNLCDLIRHLLDNPAAAGGTWLVSDGEDLSTPDLVRRLGAAMGRRVRLLPVPVKALEFLGHVTGRQAQITQLCGSLTIDMAATREQLRWSPPLTVTESLTRTVAWYLAADGHAG